MAKYRIFYGLVLAGSILFYIFYTAYLSALVLLMVFVAPLLSLLLTLPACFFIRARIRLEKDAAERDEPVPVIVEVENRWVLPCPLVQVRLRCVNHLGQGPDSSVFSPLELTESTEVAPRSRAVLRRSLVSRWCGQVEVLGAKVRLADPLRLFRLPVAKIKESQQVEILPQLREIGVFPVEGSEAPESERYSPYRPGDDPGEVFQVREFREGDSLRRVHWKLSQRMETWMVRDFSQPMEYGLYLLPEPGENPQPEEMNRMMEAFASLSVSMIQQGCIHRVGWMQEDSLHWEDLEDLDSFIAVLGSILSLGKKEGRPALKECVEENEVPRRSHLLYCTTGEKTPEGEKALFGSLSQLRQENGLRQITVLLAGRLLDDAHVGDGCTVIEVGENLQGMEELIL